MAVIKEGAKAPAFKGVDQHGKTVALADFKGQKLVLYFYPKDDTPGCTKEACMIADVYKDFKRMKVNVFGVSKDTPKSHKKFAEKYSLPFTLLSDPAMEMMDKYGAFVVKKMYGKEVRGTNRISYLIGRDGKVAKVYPEVDPASHALELLKDLKQLLKAEKATTTN